MRQLKNIIQKNKLTLLSLASAGIIISGFNNGGIEYRADPQTVRTGFASVGLDNSSWIKPPPLPEIEYNVFDNVGNVVSELKDAAVNGHTVVDEVLDSLDVAVEQAGNYLSNLELIPPMEGFYLPNEVESRYRLVAAHGQKRLLRVAGEIEENYGEHLRNMCIKYHVPYDLAFTILHIESGGNIGSVSHTGVKGIMQITGQTADYIEKNHKKSGRENPIDCSASPENNIECGVMHLKRMLAKYNTKGFKDLTIFEKGNNAIAAYNLGRSGLNRDLADAGKNHVLDLTEGEVRLETYGHVRKARAYQALLHTEGFFNR
ncbi:transglycosylase SLT domain-containing protein [Candidatus Woesearchaeota archaeon]|nr:transglycosylase SLT domain-containing protein [Candidatus Woesearchaeota archaeon]